MSEPGKFPTVDNTLGAVQSFVKRYENTHDSMTGFKIQVYLGRGVHEFVFEEDAETKIAKNITQLEAKLADAKKKLEEERVKKRKTSDD